MAEFPAGSVALALLAGLSLAAAAGFRAFLPLLVLAGAARIGFVHLHPSVGFLETNVALAALVAATLLEILGDKIPFVDHALDVGGTFVRPAAGFLAGWALLVDLPEPLSAAVALLLALITLGTHVGHAKTRVGSTALTAGVGNPVLSMLEDLVSLVLSVLAVLAPLIAAGLLLLVGYLLWRLWRRLRSA